MSAPAAPQDASPAPRNVLITGGAGGIGLATAQAFAADGERIWIADRQPSAAADLLCDESGGRFLPTDITKADQVTATVATIAEAGGVDVLVNNAGIAADAVIWKMEHAQWRKVLDVNLDGSFRMLQAVIPGMRDRGRGWIVNVTSVHAFLGRWGVANYAASKAGLVALTRVAARELGDRGITVNSVAPGWVKTSLMDIYSEEQAERSRQNNALGRLAEPEDIAAVIHFLASPAARHITGVTLPVDGGSLL